jgi:hypothetical protein
MRGPSFVLWAAIVYAASSGHAQAADITVTAAKIQAGKLVITGTTQFGNTKVRLEGQPAAAFNTTSHPTAKTFAFSIVYHPGDCMVFLQKVNANNTVGPAAWGVVADCGPLALAPRGAWVTNYTYQTNDLVTFGGSSWRAKRANLNKSPSTSTADWEVFAARGGTGPQGLQGFRGLQGPQGSQGPAGVAGAAGPKGPAGPAGARGLTGPQGMAGAAGAQGAAGPAGPAGPQGERGPTGPAGESATVVRYSDFSEDLVELSHNRPDTLCSVTFTVPSGGADARIDVNMAFRRSGSGELAVGYLIVKNGTYPTDNRFYRGMEITGQYFPTTYVMHDEELTPDSEVTYDLVASKLYNNSEPASAMSCEMTVTLNSP